MMLPIIIVWAYVIDKMGASKLFIELHLAIISGNFLSITLYQ